MFELREVAVKQEQDPSPDVSWLEPGGRGTDDPETAALDAARLESYYRDEWTMVGVYAAAEILVSTAAGAFIQTIRTGGLWGIESDSGADYFATVGREELEQLAAMLEEIGATAEQLEEVRSADAAPAEYV